MKWIHGSDIKVPYYTFENLERSGDVINAFTTRHYIKGGKPDDFFQPLMRKDSDPSEVKACITLLMNQFCVDSSHLISSAQKHTTNIYTVTEKDTDPDTAVPVPEGTDGMVTNIPGVMLQSFGADCPSVYILDPVNKALGLCHSGRKGTQQHIASVMLKTMTAAFGTSPENVLAAISPGICQDCYEVGDDVAEDFRQDYYSKPFSADVSASLSRDNQILRIINGRFHIDLGKAISRDLILAGVLPENIEQASLCTKCRSDIFYSLRAEGRISSENCALFMLKEH